MDHWPEFVVEDGHSCLSNKEGQAGVPVLHFTGWETVIFELQDAQDRGSLFSTAAIAP